MSFETLPSDAFEPGYSDPGGRVDWVSLFNQAKSENGFLRDANAPLPWMKIASTERRDHATNLRRDHPDFDIVTRKNDEGGFDWWVRERSEYNA